MVNIVYIMDLLDWNNSIEKQEQGVKLAKDVKCIHVFLQPGNRYYGKNVWDNCAKFLSERSNEEPSPYLIEFQYHMRTATPGIGKHRTEWIPEIIGEVSGIFSTIEW